MSTDILKGTHQFLSVKALVGTFNKQGPSSYCATSFHIDVEIVELYKKVCWLGGVTAECNQDDPALITADTTHTVSHVTRGAVTHYTLSHITHCHTLHTVIRHTMYRVQEGLAHVCTLHRPGAVEQCDLWGDDSRTISASLLLQPGARHQISSYQIYLLDTIDTARYRPTNTSPHRGLAAAGVKIINDSV